MSSHSSSHGVVALAFADEVLERPRLLESYACAFTDEDDITLVVLAADADEREVERTFGPLVSAAGLDETGSPDVVVLAVPSDPETTAKLAGSVQVVVSERPAPAPFATLPAASPASPAEWLQLVRGHRAPSAVTRVQPVRDHASPVAPATVAATPDYCIKPGYRPREANAYFHDAPDGLVHQPDVYALALHLAERSGARTIVDIGAGGGAKLAPFRDRFRIVALDHASNVAALTAAIPGHHVVDHDLERGIPPLDPDMLHGSVVVSADVIEHLRRPDAYLAGMAEIARHAPYVLLSTPDRARARGIFDTGPPANPAHVREWSLEELTTLLTHTGFGPHLAGYTVNTDVHLRKSTSLVIGGTQAHPAGRAASPVRVLAIVTAFNEADILGATIGYLRAQGVDVHVVDNWSTDGSFELAAAIGRGDAGVTVERFPDRPNGAWEWGVLLDRVADIAAQGEHDWTIHHDADEVRATPWPGVGLVEGIGFVDALGYSALDFTVADFRPVRDGFGAGQDPRGFFRHFEFGRRPGHFLQVKAWKGRQRVALSSAGGHDAAFDGRTIFPLKFLTRHYPLRSVEQGRRKVFADRAPRVPVAERAKGWNTHYDAVAGDETFLWDADRLLAYDDHTFATEYLVERISGIGIVRDPLPDPSVPAATPAPPGPPEPQRAEGPDPEVIPVPTVARTATDETVAVAFVDDLFRTPEILSGFASAFSADDPITLLLYAPGADPAELESRLMPLVAGTPIATDDGPEVVALAVPDDAATAAAVAAQADVVLGGSRRDGPFARLPVTDLHGLLVLMRGEAPAAPPAPVATRSRPLDAPPAPIESLERDPASGVLLSPWAGEEATYADGGEQYVHDVISSASDTSVHSRELAEAIRDWPSLYHLSPYRSTLYDCLGLTRPVDVVELGAGCGATTRWLGERMRSVLAVEGSRSRAAVIRERCADLDTVEVVVGNFADVDLRGRADLVTLIGVLEYSHLYSLRWPGDPARAAVETLELARGALREDGLLLVAIENSMGLKYWNGAREDHSGRVHESIEGYPDLRTAAAFNARQLDRMARAAGFSEVEMLLPFPDYKLPRVVVDAHADAEELGLHNWIDSLSADRGFDGREQHFSERLALREVVRAGLLCDLANSFLVLAYAGDRGSVRERLGLERDWAARHYSLDRAPVFRKRTTLRADRDTATVVEIDALVESDGGAVFGGGRVEPHVRGDLLVYRVAELGHAPDADHQLTILLAQLSDWLVERHGTGEEDADGVPLLEGRAIDAVWWNIVVDPDTGDWHEIDAEWNLDTPHPVDYILWRGIEHLPARLGGTPEQTGVVRSALGSALRLLHPTTDERRPVFEAWELSFQRAVLGIEDEHPAAPVEPAAGFRCNVCGAEVAAPAHLDRETPSCEACRSTPRLRAVVHALSLGLFGEALPLPDFPDRPDLRGVGLSDWPGYAQQLAARLGYTNTFLHMEPRLDILDPDPALEGTLDFLVSSEVFEHVPPPASRALDAAYRLLRPGGVLVLTVPYGLEGETVEHFPDLHDWTLVPRDGRHVLVNVDADGSVEEHDDLVFHGGDGLTVEMRVWSLPSLRRDLAAAGFTEITVLDDDVPEWGIAWANRCSRPILARKPRGAAAASPPSACAPEAADAADIARMKADWNERATENAPHYIASGQEHWDEAAFSESGRLSVDATVREDLPRLTGGRDPGSLIALEIGCGVGRMTEHLGAIFQRVHGVDVSGEMVRQARERLDGRHDLQFHETSGADVACLPSGSVDFAFSFIVFQHVPVREAVVSTIRDVHRVLRPGSMFKFQVQGTQEPDYLRAPKDSWLGVTFTQAELDEVAAEIGFEVVDAWGAGTQYFWQWWRKPARADAPSPISLAARAVLAAPTGRVVIDAPTAPDLPRSAR